MKWLNDSLSAYRPPYCLHMLLPGTRREGNCDLNSRTRARHERLGSSQRAEAACAACGSRNGWERRGFDRQRVLRTLEGYHDELAGFLFTGAGRGWLQARQRSRNRKPHLTFHWLQTVTKTFTTRPGGLVLPAGSAHGHCAEHRYAARTTTPMLSFLPKRRRMVRGLM